MKYVYASRLWSWPKCQYITKLKYYELENTYRVKRRWYKGEGGGGGGGRDGAVITFGPVVLALLILLVLPP